MGRMIDADKLYEDLANNLSFIMGDGSDGEAIDTYATIGDIIHDTFNAQPTAYDPDKVVEQLYGLKKYGNKYDSYWESSLYQITEFENKAINDAVEKAIEIVKGGGVDVN